MRRGRGQPPMTFMPRPLLQLAQYVLYQHPLAVTSLEVCDVPASVVQRGNVFTLMERSPLGCLVHSYTLQAESKEDKVCVCVCVCVCMVVCVVCWLN